MMMMMMMMMMMILWQLESIRRNFFVLEELRVKQALK